MEPKALERRVGYIGSLFTSIGCIVGSSWLFAPYYAASYAGPASIITWVIAMLVTLLAAFICAELASTFVVTGGIVSYTLFSHGKPLSYLLAWLHWLSYVIIPALEVRATLQYAAYYYPSLVQTHTAINLHNKNFVLSDRGIMVAAAMMLLFVIINVLGVRLVNFLNAFIVWWKLLIPATAIVYLLSYHPHWSNLTSHGFMPMGKQGILNALMMGGVIFSFAGFKSSINLESEAIRPDKQIPFALIGSVLVTAVLYIALQIAFIVGISPKAIAQGWTHLSLAGSRSPFVSIAAAVGLIWLASLLYIDAVLSPSSTGMIGVLSTSRLTFAMSKLHFLPEIFSKLNNHSVPFISIIINFVVGMLFLFPFPTWQYLMVALTSLGFFCFAFVPVSLFTLRQQHAEKARPFRVPFVGIFSFAAFYICGFLILLSTWDVLWKVGILLLFGLLIVVLRANFDKQYRRGTASLFLYMGYIVALMTISYFTDWGGGHGSLNIYNVMLYLLPLCAIVFWLCARSSIEKELSRQFYDSVFSPNQGPS